MNREILYRAKCCDPFVWVYGFPIKINNYFKMLPNIESEVYVYIWEKSLCQYIGICDKNGNKIFEHDIVKVTERYGEKDESPFIMIGEIVYEDCMFGLKTKDGKFYTPIWENEELEVIGNSFDNKDWSENNDNI